MKLSYNEVFLQELEKLNKAQKDAVTKLDGPVLVIAGPGTGKTQVLAARIGNILKDESTGAAPHNILCLTYTDAGTIAMRQRLLKFIGPDAYRVHIHTFHSFCNLVIQDNLDQFGMRNLEPVSDLERIEIFQQLIDNLPAGHPLKRYVGKVYYEADRMKKLFEIMKKESWTCEMITKKVKEYLDELPLMDEYIYKRANLKQGIKVGDVKQKEIDKVKERLDMLCAAAKEYESLQKMMAERNRYDFDDMISWVLNAFRTNPDLLRTYQEQYQFFLVDEFQDTSGAQNELLKELTSWWESPNVFVVGDDDQSIYRFSGANIDNILTFHKSFEQDMKTVMMTENYRSTQQILDAAGKLIDRNTERLTHVMKDLDKSLKAKTLFPDVTDAYPQVWAHHNTMHEIVNIAMEIEKLQKKGVNLGEVAVIYRNHSQADDIVRYLESKKIPLSIRKKTDILTQPLVNKLLTILRYVDMESKRPHSGEHLLFEILHYDFFDIQPLEVARLSVEIAKKNYGERNTSWRDAIARIEVKRENNLFSNNNESINAIKRLSNDIEYWIKESHNLTVQQLLEKIIVRGGLMYYIMQSPEKMWMMQVLNTFFNFVKEESSKNSRITTTDLFRTLDLMQKNELALPLNKVTQTENGVNFITAHSSKGLEFEYVFMLGCNTNAWDRPGRSSTYSFPANLFVSLGGDESEEARRLFYVAMTRAKKQLVISYSNANAEGKDLEKSRFVAELLEAEVPAKNIVLPEESLLEFSQMMFAEGMITDLELVDSKYMDMLLENYSLSVTHLNNYLKCPLSFYFQNLLRVPSAKNEYMAFGSAVHFALEQQFKKMGESGNREFPGKKTLLSDFEWYMNRNKDCFTDDQFKRRMEYGASTLNAYFDKYQSLWNKVVVMERAYRNIEFEGIPLNGKLDKIEFEGTSCNVVDYKTGQYENGKMKLGRPLEVENTAEAEFDAVYGGDYWRQAVFYKILIDNDRTKSWDMQSAEFDFIEPDKKSGEYKKEKIYITEQDVAVVKEQIRNTYRSIKNHEFSKGCGKENCSWCTFMKYNSKRKKVIDEKLLELQTEGNEE
jgi:DNA helicase-2/ATP-dependent DNA helicase PcrA